MPAPMHDDKRVEKLLSRYVDGVVTEAELVELDDAIRNQPDVAERAATWFLLHRQTQEVASEQRFSEVVDGVIVGSLSLPTPSASGSPRHAAPTESQSPLPRRLWVIVPAATMALAAAVLFLAVLPGDEANRSSTQRQRLAVREAPVAAITSVTDATWQGGADVGIGATFRERDRLRLSKGIVKLTYNCGAELHLEGPCDFVVLDEMQGKLIRGKLTVDVPPRAFGFGVVCPSTDIIDLGTSFGVAVDESGETDLRVFDGEVMCAAENSRGRQSPDYQHVRADEALRFSDRSTRGKKLAPSDDTFASLREHRRGRVTEDDGIGSGKLALWLTAQHGVELDSTGRVAAWADRLTESNRAGQDVVQPDTEARPRFVASAIGAKPAVRFDGASDYLVTTPLATTDEQTIAMVVAFGKATYKSARLWGAQILNYDGPPSREAAGVVMPGVIQIGESLREQEFSPGRLNALAFAGFVGATAVESGRVDAPTSLRQGQPVVLLYRYSHAEQTAALWVNGENVATTRAVAPVAIVSRKIIGRHAWKDLHFAGDLAELRIYNEALAPADMERLNARLGREYGVTVAGSDAQ